MMSSVLRNFKVRAEILMSFGNGSCKSKNSSSAPVAVAACLPPPFVLGMCLLCAAIRDRNGGMLRPNKS
ncbi:hypothetical protein D8674_015267 [Pyrus ussuriensis x Pyrus communis]|uniref:Uncharacterized protein n=1 Tax=Pyrus ussuriensis x Pyrus communis TaxID=2448454 RepID=A0A5N5GVS9_9ROSA|nr:hypothetical protein D8674_015267 [Pyrus ussuriensis x Pyrus communis]